MSNIKPLFKYTGSRICGIMDENESGLEVLPTPLAPRLINLYRRFFAMTEYYHAFQLPLLVFSKVCPKCEPPTEKPLDQFSKDKNSRDGLCSMCKECAKAYHRQYYAKNQERL